jgi:hypothetical protein
MEIFAWLVYGLGWHIHPSRYPLPHVMVLDFLAEVQRWLRREANLSNRTRYVLRILISTVTIVGVPFLFVTYVKYLFWLWSGHHAVDILEWLAPKGS